MGWTAGANPLLTIPTLLLVLIFKILFITTATGANPLLTIPRLLHVLLFINLLFITTDTGANPLLTIPTLLLVLLFIELYSSFCSLLTIPIPKQAATSATIQAGVHYYCRGKPTTYHTLAAKSATSQACVY